MNTVLVSRGADAISLALKKRAIPLGFKRVLVVGCASGREAAVLARNLQTRVVGIDLNAQFDPFAQREVDLRWGDARKLDFPPGSFDLVYSYHALEHIPEYETALSEMCRVLQPGGYYCIGTPNRERLIGYIGSENASLLTKLRWNYQDWTARLSGRFRNEFGAHAGFSTTELADALARVFGDANELAADYYENLYPNHRGTIHMLKATGLCRFVFPSIYFFGKRIH